MAYWSWVKGLETGLVEIDDQHRKIVEYINLLDEAIREMDVMRIEAVMDLLLEYTSVHFEFEEKLMKKAGYEKLDEHKLIHESFKTRVLKLRKRISNGENISQELMMMLVKWLVGHIKNEDKGYVETVRPILANRSFIQKISGLLFGGK